MVGLLLAASLLAGPLLTSLLMFRKRSKRELMQDCALIALIQIIAMGWSVYVAFAGRPMMLVFEYRLFRVVHANEMLEPVSAYSSDLFSKRDVPLIALREFKDAAESLKATMAALQGVSLAVRSELWVDYASTKTLALSAAKPLEGLRVQLKSEKSAQILDEIISQDDELRSLKFLPVIGRERAGIVLLNNKTGEPQTFVNIDSFGRT